MPDVLSVDDPAVVQTRSADGYAGLSEVEKLAMDKLERLEKLFAGRHFDREVVLLCSAVVSSVQAQPA
jgi:hypothetical protein